MSFLAKNIRFLRKQRAERQEDVSVLFNKKANTVGNWENRKSEPSVGEIVKLAEHFGVSLHDLLNIDLTHAGVVPLTIAAKQVPDAHPKMYPVSESTPSLAMDDQPDSFWVLIRELRAINEKLEDLKRTLDAGGVSDKSNH
jgi:transcriptional regulator with XRE-family HTH domain